MKYTFDQDTLTLYLTGRIDAANAPAVEAEINECRKINPAKKLVLDLEELAYISSAGLRVVLRLRKDYPDIRLINASSEVYDIFELTGFVEMMTIEKAYRRLSVDGCELIGQGANGSVYRIDADTIIKVYKNPDSLPDIQRERELARKAFVMGIPTAIPYDVVKVGESYGSVFELLNAKSFTGMIQEDRANMEACVRLSVELMKKLHSTELKPGELPDQQETGMKWVTFAKDHIPAASYEKLLRMYSELPPRQTMLHGDCHMKNIMMQNGETLLIDMDTLSMGHPIFEFAQLYITYSAFGELDSERISHFHGLPAEECYAIWEKTVELYFDGDKVLAAAVADKARLLAYLHLMRRCIRRNIDPPLVEHCKKNIIALIDAIDTLDF